MIILLVAIQLAMIGIYRSAASKAGSWLRDFLANCGQNVGASGNSPLLPHRAARHALASFMLLPGHPWHVFSYHKEGGT
jgi:hypothetical protein